MKAIRYCFFGVALLTGLQAELLPNPSGTEAGASGVSSSNWYGLAVQNSGFLLGGSQAAGDRSTEDQGFSSYYNARSSDSSNSSGGVTQLTSAGAFAQGQVSSGPVFASASLTSFSGAADILSETVNISSSFAASRSVAAMAPSSASIAPQASASTSAWDLAPQTSSTSLASASAYNPYTSSTQYSASTLGWATQSSSASLYSAQNTSTLGFAQQPSSYSYMSQFASSYAWQLPTVDPSAQETSNSNVTVAYGLLNAGASSLATLNLYQPITTTNTVSGQQLVNTVTTINPTTVNTFNSAVPEPGTWALIVSAMAALAVRRRYMRS